MSIDWQAARSRFPALDGGVYLNTAGGGPLSTRSASAGRRYYDQSLEDGDVHWDDWMQQVETTRKELARFLNTRPTNLAFAANASTGLNIAARMLRDGGRAQTSGGQVDANDAPSGRILTIADEFPSCTLPWLQLGFEVDFVATAPDGGFSVGDLEAGLADDTIALAASFVQYKSGFRCHLGDLGSFCREHDLALVVDATQGFGAFPIDVTAGCVDFLSFSGYKWATAGYSIGALYVGERFLDSGRFPMVGWRSARDPYALAYDRLDLTDAAAGLEQGHPPFAGVFALGASLELINEIGIRNIAARIVKLAAHLHARLDEAGVAVLSTRDREHLSGITIVAADDPAATVAALRERGVIVSSRGEGIRVSLHYYNNRADIDRFVEALHEHTAPCYNGSRLRGRNGPR